MVPEMAVSAKIRERSVYDSLKEWIMKHPDLTEGSHRFAGTEFRLQGMEFMHFHGHRQLDLILSRDDYKRVIEEEKAEKHRFARGRWVTLFIKSEKDVATAKELVELAYGTARKIMERRTPIPNAVQHPTSTSQSE